MVDLVGQTFGRLTVIEKSGSKLTGNVLRAVWKCECSCGKLTEVTTNNLRREKRPTESCGCIRSERYDDPEYRAKMARPTGGRNGESPLINAIYSQYKCSARKRNYEFDLDLELFKSLILDDCSFCGSPPANTYRKGARELKYNGIDRSDSTRGYSILNVLTCCKVCNFAKRTMSHEEFIFWLHRISERWCDRCMKQS